MGDGVNGKDRSWLLAARGIARRPDCSETWNCAGHEQNAVLEFCYIANHPLSSAGAATEHHHNPAGALQSSWPSTDACAATEAPLLQSMALCASATEHGSLIFHWQLMQRALVLS